MKVNTVRFWRITLLGGAAGFLFAFVAVLFGIGQPDSAGQRGLIGNLFCWLSSPLGWVAEYAAQRQIISRENIPLIIISTCLYWATLGAILAGLFSCIRNRMLHHPKY